MKIISSLTLQQLLYYKNNLFTFTLKEFIILNCHLISNKKKRNYNNINFIYNTPAKIDIINLKKSLITLRITLNLISEISFLNGKILTILETKNLIEQNHLNNISKKIHQNFISNWIPGLLSNFKEFKKQNKNNKINHIPNFIFLLSNFYFVELKSEIISLKIPCTIIQNPIFINLNFLYTINLILNNFNIKLFISQLICNSINMGYNKKIFFFTKKKIKFI
jgi:ribosomal S2-like protein